jgi:hypothetical protein
LVFWQKRNQHSVKEAPSYIAWPTQASFGGWATLTGKYKRVCLLTWTEITGGAPLLALFEKWPAEPPTPFDSAGGRVFILSTSPGAPSYREAKGGAFDFFSLQTRGSNVTDFQPPAGDNDN